jgi:hypothetical protein
MRRLAALALLVVVGCGGGGSGDDDGGVQPDSGPITQPPVTCEVPAAGMPVDTAGAAKVGDGTPASCTQAALQAAVDAGGVITFDCGPAPVTITMTQPILINNGGDVEAAAIGAAKGMLMFAGKLPGDAPQDLGSMSTWGGTKAVGGIVIGTMIGANNTVAVASRDQAIGLAPSCRLSSASGTLFGYGYRP